MVSLIRRIFEEGLPTGLLNITNLFSLHNSSLLLNSGFG